MTSPGHKHRIVPLEVGSPKEFNKKSDFFFSSDVKDWMHGKKIESERKRSKKRKDAKG